MKATKLVLALVVSLFSFSAIMAQSHDHSKMDHSKMKMDAKKVYTCKMHPEIKSDKPGECPKCGMTLVEKKMDMKKGKMAKTYTCGMHPEIKSDKPGKCPKCGMTLVEKKMKMDKKMKMN